MSILDGVQRVLSLYAEGAVELSFTDVATRLSLPKALLRACSTRCSAMVCWIRTLLPAAIARASCCRWRRGHGWPSAGLGLSPVLARLSERSGLTAYLSTLNQRETVVLQRLDGSHPVQVLSPPGSRRAASGTAMGRALLSRLSDAEFTDLYGANPVLHLPMEGRDCPGSVGELAERVARTRAERCAAVRDPLSGELRGLCLSFVSFQPMPRAWRNCARRCWNWSARWAVNSMIHSGRVDDEHAPSRHLAARGVRGIPVIAFRISGPSSSRNLSMNLLLQ